MCYYPTAHLGPSYLPLAKKNFFLGRQVMFWSYLSTNRLTSSCSAQPDSTWRVGFSYPSPTLQLLLHLDPKAGARQFCALAGSPGGR